MTISGTRLQQLLCLQGAGQRTAAMVLEYSTATGISGSVRQDCCRAHVAVTAEHRHGMPIVSRRYPCVQAQVCVQQWCLSAALHLAYVLQLVLNRAAVPHRSVQHGCCRAQSAVTAEHRHDTTVVSRQYPCLKGAGLRKDMVLECRHVTGVSGSACVWHTGVLQPGAQLRRC
jgi:hypothetical protein